MKSNQFFEIDFAGPLFTYHRSPCNSLKLVPTIYMVRDYMGIDGLVFENRSEKWHDNLEFHGHGHTCEIYLVYPIDFLWQIVHFESNNWDKPSGICLQDLLLLGVMFRLVMAEGSMSTCAPEYSHEPWGGAFGDKVFGLDNKIMVISYVIFPSCTSTE